MTQRTDTNSSLVKLGDTDLVLEDRDQDIRGRNVFDVEGEEIGTVTALYVDEGEREIRFVEVASGGFLGLGEKSFLLPVEAVEEVSEDGVLVDSSRETVAGAPPFDTGVVPRPAYQRELYDYYGYDYPSPYPGGA